ncbi:hypothetical protein DF185_13250 [Marinifilum breve]|uniref:Uncharacterized protein n=1 Tax=Marinifilum breve TaxID=2184082 RepID=A0A2V3ZWN1_9BACT|nr:hypothetical protein DF185_13250 [Marinifilum breve]
MFVVSIPPLSPSILRAILASLSLVLAPLWYSAASPSLGGGGKLQPSGGKPLAKDGMSLAKGGTLLAKLGKPLANGGMPLA